MNRLKSWLSWQRPSFRIYFLIWVAGVALHALPLLFFFTLFGYFVFESLDAWITALRRDRAYDSVMTIFEPDPTDPQREIKAEWYWERLTKSEAIVLTKLADLIRRSR